jgi:hypothetical protein
LGEKLPGELRELPSEPVEKLRFSGETERKLSVVGAFSDFALRRGESKGDALPDGDFTPSLAPKAAARLPVCFLNPSPADIMFLEFYVLQVYGIVN